MSAMELGYVSLLSEIRKQIRYLEALEKRDPGQQAQLIYLRLVAKDRNGREEAFESPDERGA